MDRNWGNVVVTDVIVALYVAPGTGKSLHRDRPFHGFVLNDSIAEKNIHFSDGTVLHTGPNQLHYLPKGSTYRVENIIPGGCWAINFNLLEDIAEAPFSLGLRNVEPILKIFSTATAAWKSRAPACNAIVRKSIYDLILKILAEEQRSYMPNEKERLIQPALELIAREYTRNDLSVQALAALCGISEAYFRRIFQEKFSISPRAYIIQLRMEYAKKLLQSDQLPVHQVAELCGYYEPCHFSREFSRYTGVSPKAYWRKSKSQGG